jgi:hypothetical protein
MRLASAAAARVPAYEIETLLGNGPGGVTHLAQASYGLLVVKTLGAVHELPSPAERLSASLSGFHHAGVATTVAIEHDPGGALRLVRDYVRGLAFDRWLASSSAPVRHDVARSLAATVAHIHGSGLAHGRIVAANVIITTSGGNSAAPVIVDLGAHLLRNLVAGEHAGLAAMAERDRMELQALCARLTGTP